MEIFDELAKLDDQPELMAFGLAGQCGVLSLRGKCEESNAVMGRLLPVRDRLANRQMQRLLEFAIKKNRAELGRQTTGEWDRWLEEQLREPSDNPPSG